MSTGFFPKNAVGIFYTRVAFKTSPPPLSAGSQRGARKGGMRYTYECNARIILVITKGHSGDFYQLDLAHNKKLNASECLRFCASALRNVYFTGHEMTVADVNDDVNPHPQTMLRVGRMSTMDKTFFQAFKLRVY